jgi:hypothetical protein
MRSTRADRWPDARNGCAARWTFPRSGGRFLDLRLFRRSGTVPASSLNNLLQLVPSLQRRAILSNRLDDPLARRVIGRGRTSKMFALTNQQRVPGNPRGTTV